MKLSPIVLLSMLAVIGVAALQASPQTVTLTATKDCTVLKTAPDTAFPSDPNLSARKEDGSNQQFFLWEFRLPADCRAQNIDPATFKFKLTMLEQKLSTQRAVYLNIIKEAADLQVDDLNALTFNNAPGVLKDLETPITTNNIDSATAGYVGYSDVTVTDGQVWEYVPTGAYLTALTGYLEDDENQRLIFLYHPRYVHPEGDWWASLENTEYDGPQVEFTYEPSKIAVDQSDDYLTVTEGLNDDSFSVYLTSEPTDDVTITFDLDEDLIITPSSLVFSSSNYATPQAVTVSTIDDNVAKATQKLIISPISASNDVEFDQIDIPNVFVTLFDNDSTSISLEPIKDSTAKRLQSSTSFASGDISIAKYNNIPNVDIQVAFIQFQLPADFVYAVDASLSITQTSTPNVEGSSKVYLVGINDDVEQADADLFTWINAPALDSRMEAVDGLNGYNGDLAEYLADLELATAGSAGITFSTSPAESQAICDWLSKDTDKVVTIMVVKEIENEFIDSFASIENETFPPATLDINYGTAVQSYCDRPGRDYDPMDFNNDCIVNFEDYAILADAWMQN